MKKFFLPFAMLFFCLTAICQNPLLLKDVYPGITGSGIQQIVKTSNYTFFNAEDDDPDANRGLYRTDGTPAGTVKLNLTYPTYNSTKAEKLTALGNKIVFAGDNSPNYGEIWASDGTQPGTIAIERFQPTAANVSPVVELNTMGAYVYYSAVNNSNQAILKRTDGTVAGTSELYNFGAYAGIPPVVFLTPLNNILYFIVYDQFGTGNDHLWRSDGTNAGTYMVYDFTSANYVESYIMTAGNNFYIMLASENGALRDNTLWKSDGTTAGTVSLKYIGSNSPGPINNIYPPFAAIGSTLYFAGLDGNGKELWKTDGTAAGTVLVADINAGSASSNPLFFTVLNNKLYFAATTVAEGTELWKYDGIIASLVKDINPGNAGSTPGPLVVSNNSIVFRASTIASGSELWITDGTAANTFQIADINPGATGSGPNLLTPGNPVYFTAGNGVTGPEIFVYDNTAGIEGLHKIYVNDNSTTGDVFTTAVGNNANPGTKSAPVATINYALTLAQPGDIIEVDAGTYTEQVTIDKAITLKGAGKALTEIQLPASGLINPPGFTEKGVIQSALAVGNIHVINMTVTSLSSTSVHCILLQTGGSVKNCLLRNGNQGVFFRAATGTLFALTENNVMQDVIIGINCQGAGMSATVLNNTINNWSGGFSAGIFAGLDFGPIPQLTVTGNILNGFKNYGIFANSFNSNYAQNSITGISGKLIEQFSGNPSTATCNWFGTDDAEVIASKISGAVNYLPWLVNGTDTDPVAAGFQPLAGTCTGRQNKFYVNNNSLSGDVYTTAVGNNANNGFSSAPFATITYAIGVAQAGDIIYVDAGTYAERIFVNKALTFKGAYAGINPGTSLNRGLSETILLPSAENNLLEIITVQAAGVSFDGFLFDGDNPAITGSVSLNSVDVNAGMGIFNGNLQTDNLVIKNNIFKNFLRYGMLLQKTTSALTGIQINQNHIDNISSRTPRDGRAVGLFNNAYATVTNNQLTRVNTGVIMANFNVSSTDPVLIASNIIEAYSVGITSSNHSNVTSSFTVADNQITVADLIAWNAPGSSPVNNCTGINMGFAGSSNNLSLTNNSITGTRTGIGVSQFTSTGQLMLTNNIVSGTQTGVQLSSINTAQPVLVSGGSISNSSMLGLFYIGNGTATDKLITNNLALVNNVVGMDASAVGGNLQLEFAGVTISGGTTGIRFYGTQLSLPGNTLSGVSFSNQSKEYILQTSHSFEGQTIDASTVSFDGLQPVNMTLAQLFATEDKLTHKIDFDSVGYFKLKPTEVFVTANSFAADLPPVFGTPTTTPDINRAVGAAASGDIIHVKAGTYVNQVNIDKPLTLRGEGNTLTFIQGPAAPLADPADFDEKGIIQSISGIGNVNIENLSIDGTNSDELHSILIQGGGQVINCEMKNANNGIFFRDRGTVPHTAVASGNNIHNISYVGINFQGAALTATAINNVVDLNNAVFGMGFIVGYDFGPIPQFTALNNAINNHNGFGFSANSYNSHIHDNSITGSAGAALTTSSGNQMNATCNWFGTVVKEQIAAKIMGNVHYTPWLINGTDADPAIGFQPVLNSCLGQPKYYVNDNNLSGDVFTTAVGSNSNNGSPSSPFATPDYAYSIAQPGDTIYVDAGTYDLGGLTYSFPKPVVLLGSNYQVSPNDAANKLLLNAGRNAESILTNGKMVIASSGISVEGFTWDVGNRTGIELTNTAVPNNTFGNFKFTKNRYKINSASTQVALTGKIAATISLLANSDFIFSDNRFEKYDASFGTSFNLGYLKNISFTDNSFVLAGATPRTQNVVTLGNTGLVDAVIFSGNTADQSNGIVGGSRIANANISANKIYNSGSSLSMNNNMPESSNIEISGNIMENTTGNAPFILYTRVGGGLAGSTNIFKAEGNIMTAVASPGSGQLYGSFNITVNNSVQNPNIIIGGNKLSYSGDFSTVESQFVRSISLRGKIENATVENNELTFSNSTTLLPVAPTGLLPANPGITVITDFGSTLYIPSNAVINILNNKIHGFKQSVAVYDPSTGTGAQNPYIGYGNLPAGAVVNINNNSFTGDSISINNGNVGQSVHATCNWYGSAASQILSAKITTSSVDYIPWLVNGTDNNIATGFQPVAGTCTGTPPVVSFNASTNVSCFGGANGTISITAGGGTTPYSFAWSRNAVAGFSNSEDITNATAGTYSLILTDANGSIVTLNGIVISQPPALTSTITDNSTVCTNIATASATGGTGAYTYLWSNGATSATITNIAAGNYTVIVTDANGCTVSSGITLTIKDGVKPKGTVTHVSCYGGSNGTFTITSAHGAAPFTYSIDGINFQSSNVFLNLVAGTYTVTVKDANNCTGFETKTITGPAALVVTLDQVRHVCTNGPLGSININVAGGSPGYTYSWTGPNSYTSANKNISNLNPGTYTVTVTDQKGCSSQLAVTVLPAAPINVSAQTTNISCKGGSNGSITLTVTGGSGSGFSYSWTGPGGFSSTAQNISGLQKGNYNVIITDNSSACILVKSYILTEPNSSVSISTSGSNVSGCNNLGSISATASGGGAPYQYKLNTGNYQASGNFLNLNAGTYLVTVKDTSGCTDSKSVSITDNGNDAYEKNDSKGKAENIVIGSMINARIAVVSDEADWFKFSTPAGTASYTLSLTHPSASFHFNLYAAINNSPALVPTSTTATSKTYTLNGNSTYYIEVTGGLSFVCYNLMVTPPMSFTEAITTNSSSIMIEKGNPAVAEIQRMSAKAYPNPHQGSFSLQITSPTAGTAKIELFTISGQKLQEKTVSIQKSRSNTVPFTVAMQGTIVYRIRIGDKLLTGKVLGF